MYGGNLKSLNKKQGKLLHQRLDIAVKALRPLEEQSTNNAWLSTQTAMVTNGVRHVPTIIYEVLFI